MTKRQHDPVAILIRSLMDPENQPHQWVGDEDGMFAQLDADIAALEDDASDDDPATVP